MLTSLYMFHLDPENSEKKSKQDFKDVISLGIFKKKGNMCVWGAGVLDRKKFTKLFRVVLCGGKQEEAIFLLFCIFEIHSHS